MSLDITAIRRHFPILGETINGHPLVYLDSAATAQKPSVVLDALHSFLVHDNANVHRSIHPLAERATQAFEDARKTVQRLLNAASPAEVIVTKSATEAINIVARGVGESWGPGDRALVTRLEHHSNIVPWLQLKERRGITVDWIDIGEDGRLRMDELERAISRGGVKLVAVTGQSNVLGCRPDVKRICALAHAAGALVCVDAAQLVAHANIDVRSLDCDFLAFSGHKLYGPTGVGILWGRRELLERLPPLLGGVMMLADVTDEGFIPAELPAKFEAGTPPAAELVGLAAAIEWFRTIPAAEREAHEAALLRRAVDVFAAVPGVTVLPPADAASRFGCVSFVADGAHAHDVAHLLGEEGMCLRAGHHCARPLHRRLGIEASLRLSVAAFNTLEEIDAVGPALERVLKRLRS